MMEVYVIVARRKSIIMHSLCALVLGLTLLLLIMSFWIQLLIILAVVFAGVFYFMYLYSNQEFEYSYFDGELRFAKVLNKSNRRELKGYSMDEVMIIAPSGDPGIERYEKDPKVKKKDYTSGYRNVPYYELVVRSSDNGLVLIKFEPDDEYLDAICTKYAQKVVRRGH